MGMILLALSCAIKVSLAKLHKSEDVRQRALSFILDGFENFGANSILICAAFAGNHFDGVIWDQFF